MNTCHCDIEKIVVANQTDVSEDKMAQNISQPKSNTKVIATLYR